MKYKLNEIYEIIFYDHFSTENKGSKDAVEHLPTILKVYGVFVGYNKKYIVLSWFFENPTSDNNENMHILKSDIIKTRLLK